MIKRLFLILIACDLCGCAGPPSEAPLYVSMLSPKQLESEDTSTLCNTYACMQSEKVKRELMRRGEIPEDEWALIEQQRIRIGMSDLGLLCAWGLPLNSGAIDSVGSLGVRNEWVYRPYGTDLYIYIYTEDGKITSW